MIKTVGDSSKAGKGTTLAASSNWLTLKKSLKTKEKETLDTSHDRPKKRRRLEARSTRYHSPTPSQASTSYTPDTPQAPSNLAERGTPHRKGETLAPLKDMILGNIDPSESQKQPGKYLALDCEMVGVGIDGAESSLARVSIVNFYGVVQMDEFVRQRERVVDYRTQYSGIREKDMIKAKHFDEVQKKVAKLLKDQILVGHAVHHDLKALLLSHPRHLTRDTQVLAGKHKVTKSKYIALRNLVKQELDVTIQTGEHSSVTDARATMAVFRLHRKVWDTGFKLQPPPSGLTKRKRGEVAADDIDGVEGEAAVKATLKSKQKQEFPGGGRKGVSSGLSVVVRGRKTPSSGKTGGAGAGGGTRTKWWKELVSSGSGSKMTMGP